MAVSNVDRPPSARKRSPVWWAAVLVTLAACGGDDPVELSIFDPPTYASRTVVVLTGRSFVPPGSDCPRSGEYVIIGTLGPHTLSYRNAATGVEGPVFDELWVCNSDGGRSMTWRSNPIDLATGENVVTITMVAGARRSSAMVTLRPIGG